MLQWVTILLLEVSLTKKSPTTSRYNFSEEIFALVLLGWTDVCTFALQTCSLEIENVSTWKVVHKALFTRDTILRYFWVMAFNHNQGKLLANQGKLLTKHKVSWFVVRQELILANRSQCLKNIFFSQYLFIAILCVKMYRVNKA